MLLPSVRVNSSAIHGTGLVATEPIPRGCVIWMPCPTCPVWSVEAQRALDPERAVWLDTYAYTLESGEALLPCENAYLMNHSCDAGALDFGLDFGIAVHDIAPGEEVTCDYRSFASDPHWKLECRCGRPGCVGQFQSDDGLRPEIQQHWRERIAPALALLPEVPQPLHSILIVSSTCYRLLYERRVNYSDNLGWSIRAPSFRRLSAVSLDHERP